ncbi:prolipoprotein diacylglyceryl transferase [Paenibacillus sp. MER TA 81-3]|uniref:prolipoprotein diacylglyceryl transferase n=1 Tax=Paenibacillus sp. MER TA 81-3 TaxID=2939573 RepID=UPI002040B654|nr:prolipoprotein diacylglyceryl transferase [Paenibacillus sp. MER TA 81-3]MCM3339429.1 prolipoprotein diacylglyceryl transferase [Paenibacillus sp. MER TA 81-3]
MATLLLDPIAFQLGPLKVHWYGLILGTAALVGLLLAIREGKRFGISQDFFMDLLLFGVPSALVGARAYYVAFKWDDYKDDWLEIFKIWHGGIAIYGALIGAVICALIYVRKKGYSFWRIADFCAPGLLIGQAIGRWGNYVNQEAYGGPASESFLRNTLHLPDFIVNQMNVNGTFHHPTFLYESVWSFVGVLLLFGLRRLRGVRSGEVFISYLIWYSIGRFFIEGLRTDSLAYQGSDWVVSLVDALWSPMYVLFEPGFLDPDYGNVRISQLLAIFLIVAGIILIIVRRATGAANTLYSSPITSARMQANAAPQQSEGTSTSSTQASDAKNNAVNSAAMQENKPRQEPDRISDSDSGSLEADDALEQESDEPATDDASMNAPEADSQTKET